MKISGLLALSVMAALPVAASAATCSNKNYGVELFVYGSSGLIDQGTRCEDTAQSFFDLMNNAGLKSIVPAYNQNLVSSAQISFNSLPILVDFETSGPDLRFRIAALGIDMTFSGTDRDASGDMLEDYVKKSGILSKILEYQATHTPNSPITGPDGMIPVAAATDFDTAMSDSLNEYLGAGSENPSSTLGAAYGKVDMDGKKGDITRIPFSHVWRSKEKPGQLFTLSGSLAQVTVAGAASYHGGLGIAFRSPMTTRWALTPSLRYSVTGSADLASVAGMYAAALASTYHVPLGRFDMVIGNMAGYYKTTKFSVGDYSFNPDIKTWALRNGVMLSQPVSISGVPLSVEYSLVDTRYTGGTEFFVDNTQEIGVSLGTNRGGNIDKAFGRFGLRYLRGKDSSSISLSGSYWF